ncbi:8804_t:CDS:2, partial [Scutellospora calospora]
CWSKEKTPAGNQKTNQKTWIRPKDMNFCELVQDKSEEENRLRDKKNTQPIRNTNERQEIEINNNPININSTSMNKAKKKLDLSLVDTLKLYNVTDNILSLPTKEMPSGNDEDNEKSSEEKLGKFLNNEELSKTQKKKINNLLKQEKDLFA